ncbi:response regulator [Dyadobacter psychrotolerans]|uniref:Response regulator transcription factor n=1 Tax=Dyadobacter psychrotolerans TaxID=2541721 RepID=A0A4R5DWS2_9BACT|nr:response regulator transcription factor [Dyadobacter psychrotolerans]TDE16870.1 response regulator transcription factor [Dyadobacter psychrotolerans]
MLKIAVIEDYFVFRFGLRGLLEKNFSELDLMETEHSADYGEKLERFQPDLVILGINGAGKANGFYLTKKIKTLYKKVPVIIYDIQADYAAAVKYIRSSANGYLSKTDGEDELLTCIKTVMLGKNYVCRKIQENIIEHLIMDKPASRVHKKLSTRESEIASHISDGEKTSDIAHKLGLKSSTVSTMKSKIYSKLGVSNAVELRMRIKA